MAPLPVIADTFRCTLNWSAAGGVSPVNVLHVRSVTLDEEGVITAFDDNLTDAMFTPLAAGHVAASMDVIQLDGHSASVHGALGGLVNGGASGQGIPNMAIVVSLRTDTRGPRGRGRVFVGPITEDINQGSGVWTTGGASAMLAAWSTFKTAMLADGADLVVASYVHEAAVTVDSLSVSEHIRSQRRRLRQTY